MSAIAAIRRWFGRREWNCVGWAQEEDAIYSGIHSWTLMESSQGDRRLVCNTSGHILLGSRTTGTESYGALKAWEYGGPIPDFVVRSKSVNSQGLKVVPFSRAPAGGDAA